MGQYLALSLQMLQVEVSLPNTNTRIIKLQHDQTVRTI